MTDKQKLRIANNWLDGNSARIMIDGITEQSNEIYLQKLEKIYRIESETIFKESEKRERFIRK